MRIASIESLLREMKRMWDEIAKAVAERRPVVAATVVRDTGSVPRRTGAKMLIYPDGRTRESVGGGLFESLVVRDALAGLACGQGVTPAYSFNPTARGPHAF